MLKNFRKKLRIKKSKKNTLDSSRISKTKRRISDFMQSSFQLKTEIWREQVEDACFLYENVRFTRTDTIQKPKFEKVNFDEVFEMQTKIEALQAEKRRLSRKLERMEPKKSEVYYDQPSNLDLTPPPPMSPVIRLAPRKPSRDSDYYSSDYENSFQVPKIERSVDYNLYYLAL